MLSKHNTTILQKKFFIVLIVLGLILIVLAILPDVFSTGKKGFGYIQLFFLRNGFFIFLAGLILLLFPGIINYIINTFNDKEFQSERTEYFTGRPSFSKYEFILLLLFLIIANFFTIYFIGKEKYIYHWDAALFWSKYIQISAKLKDSPLGAVISVLSSIQYADYNYFAPFLLMPFSLLFGVERLPYILSIVNIYVFPSAISFLFLYKRFVGIMFGERPPYSAIVITIFTFFAFPFIFAPVLYGKIGIGGFFIISLILFAYFKYPFPAQKYRTLMLIGILISILVLFRRWYSFWAVSFFIALIINELIFLYIDYRFDRKRSVVLAKKALFIIFVSGIFFIMIAAPRLLQIITTDYSFFSVYRSPTTTLEHFKIFLKDFGLFYVILSLLGLFLSFYYKKTRKIASFLLIQWVIMFLLFTRLQGFGTHHYYILEPTILLFIVLLMTTLSLKVKSKTIKVTICSTYILISTISFFTVFSPEVSSYVNRAKIFFPQIRCYPRVRDDISEIKRMLNVIEGLLADPNDRVYVLSSSSTLNSDILQFARMSLLSTPKIGKHIYRSNEIDLRDGFPLNLFKAKYVIIADPIRCHLGCKNQRIISIPAESILKGENMGTSYRKLPYEFTLQGGTRVYIYERVNPFNQADINFLSDALRKYYPDKPFVYEANAQ
jgi:hypothetical protein